MIKTNVFSDVTDFQVQSLLDSQIGTATIHDTAKDAGATPFNYVKQLIQESFSSMTVPDTTTNRTTHQWMKQVLAQVVSLHRLIKHTQTLQNSDQGLVRDIGLYYTCWWYSLCNFQYRQHYENTCSYNVDC